MVRVAICENIDADLKRVKEMLKSSNEQMNITEYASCEPLLWDFRTGRIYFDIFFIGNHSSGLNAVEIAKRIQTIDEDSIIILMQNAEDAQKAMQDVQPISTFGYLTKPVNKLLFDRTFSKAIDRIHRDQAQVLTVSHHTHNFTVRHSYIDYIANINRKISIHLHGRETKQYGGKFSDFISLLSNEQFVRCHRNYIVNLNRVTKLTSTGFKLGNDFIPISRPYRTIVRERYNKHLFAVLDQE